MSDHALCRHFLVATRRVNRRALLPTDTGFGVTHTSDRRYWLVQNMHGKTMYEGQACCAYSARTEALLAFADLSPQEARKRVTEDPALQRFTTEQEREDFDVRR